MVNEPDITELGVTELDSAGRDGAEWVPTVEVMVNGDLDAGSAPRVHDVLQEAMALNPRQLIIDLAQCPSIDAAGIILLLDAHRRAIRFGGRVALRSPSAKLCRNLKLARVDRVLQVIGPPTPSADMSTHDNQCP